MLENKGKSYFYSLANKSFDYVQAEVPALHMAFPEYEKLNQQYEVSRLVKFLEPNILANIVNELLEDEKQYENLKESCKQAKLVWTWENEERKLLEFYENIFQSVV